MKKNYLYIVFVLLIILQLPFLRSDPDIVVDVDKRGAWTDEGLYSSQVRNFINDYGLDLEENSTLIRGPVFGLIQFVFFSIFGAKLIVGRLIVLLFTILTILILSTSKRLRLFVFLFTIIALFQFHIFQYSHFALAEMICIDFILLAIFFLHKFLIHEIQSYKWLFLSSLMIFLSYSAKIQFVYTIVLIPLSLSALFFIKYYNTKTFSKVELMTIVWSVVFALSLGLIYLLVWYLPNAEFYNYVMNRETTARFPAELSQYPGVIKFSFLNYFWAYGLKVLIICFIVLLIVFFTFRKHTRIQVLDNPLLVIVLVWILLEIHKIPMLYLPTRYLLSLFVGIGVFVSLMLSELQRHQKRPYLLIIGIIIGIINLTFVIKSYNNRTYDLKSVNEYMQKYDLSDETIIGPWAASLSWETKAKTLPVWNEFLNYKNPIIENNASIVISEYDEADSDESYRLQNISLDDCSDSVRQFNVYKYNLILYWIKQNEKH